MYFLSTIRSNRRGSAIILVVSIGAWVTLVVFTWLSFSLKNTHKATRLISDINARYAAETVISKSIYYLSSHPVPDTIIMDSSGDSFSVFSYTDSVRHSSAGATAVAEGAFLRISAQGRSGGASCGIEALFGRELSDAFRYALILSDPVPLSTGYGRIKGDALLKSPPKGVIDGKIEVGKVTIPPVDIKMFLKTMADMEKEIVSPGRAYIVFQGSKAFDRDHPPPLSGDGSLFVEGDILMDNNTGGAIWELGGKGTMIATGDIQVSGYMFVHDIKIIALGAVKCFDKARLRNVTLYSQHSVHLDDDVVFSGSIYGFESIVLSNQAVAEMPSVAFTKGLYSKKDDKTGFYLSEEARFSGTLICAGGRTLSRIEKRALFTGLLYTFGDLELQGTVFGCVVARSLKNEDEKEANALAGGTINRSQLPSSFTLPNAFGRTGENYKLTQWIEN